MFLSFFSESHSMSFITGKIAKIAEFTIPINNAPDLHIKDLVAGNSLSEIEATVEQMRNDYEVKNKDVKDPNKPVRVVIKDATGESYLEHLGNGWRLIVNKIKEPFEDKNDETGTPETTAQ